jgi:hypothetical protein
MTNLERIAGTILMGALLVLGSDGALFADGGVLLLHQAVGQFEISLFGAPTPLSTGVNDISVLLQDRSSGATLLDATVTLRLIPPTRTSKAPLEAVATRGAAMNRLLYAAQENLSTPGLWHLCVTVRRGSKTASATAGFDVGAGRSSAHDRALVHVLTMLGLVMLFILHQYVAAQPQETVGEVGRNV